MNITKSDKIFWKICLASLLVLLASITLFFLKKPLVDNASSETAVIPSIPITVVIDAGHGGRDAGASVNGIFEKDLNLSIARKVKELLSYFEVDIVMTRTDDCLLCDDSSTHKKRDDLMNRVNVAKSYNDAVFVSIHMNKFPEQKYKGLQVFYSPNNPYSEALALVLQSNNKKLLESDNERNVKKSTSSIYILDRLQIPAVLIECGFLSNPDDLSKLTDESYRNKLAFVIANSIIEYIKL